MKPQPPITRREFLTTTSATLLLAAQLPGRAATEPAAKLARDGGEKAVPVAMPRPKRWGERELAQLGEAVQQPSLYYWRNQQTKLLTQRFQQYYPHEFVQPCSSGSAALHIAVGAAGVAPGDEVITTSVTDIGTVIGVLYQNAVPVFADLLPDTYNPDPADVERKITPRTKAIIVVHLMGNPARLAELKEIADRHNLILIEDCCQAWGARYRGQPITMHGQMSCFSHQDSKHIACGDGGLVTTSDPKLGPLLIKYGDKAVNRLHPADSSNVLAPNYRITELQAAFVAAQLTRLEEIASKRSQLGALLTAELADIPMIQPQRVEAQDRCVHWGYMCRFVPEQARCDRAQFVQALAAEGAPFSAGYIPVPLYGLPMFQNHSFFAGHWPIKEAGLTTMDYRKVHLPVTEAILKTCMRFPLNEGMDEDYIRLITKAVRKVARHYAV
ncbi:MAG TPA: DegT/DnrJ/EryC1/StrS family aminotransferase [Verrucomicrobiota bacterium]|jgi:dTDP-4-amino-4,6-dideoxygalactose transaminase|nr:MAG: L-glutamine:2-deoxy-scyllo-inosose aminotransferase [Verrucomicrobia bacterium ADurb.Bin118]HPY31711.1 DegT/DnrJ/EryC1/StrS family aminotransferase [Verrucomicrobiota bacterium]HQB17981.1 DegT/DnrJ/EryC1/StrS family aminotransferase [Verrucomicrobiota bacterium]